MKKFTVISLIALYGLLSLGLRATLHTCCGEVTGIGVVEVVHACNHAEEAPVCEQSHSGCCEKKSASPQKPACNKEKKCCGKEELFILFDEVQTQPKEQNTETVSVFVPEMLSAAVHKIGICLDRELSKPRVNDPPPNDIPIYLMSSSLLVYG